MSRQQIRNRYRRGHRPGGRTTVEIHVEPAWEELDFLRSLDQYADENGEVTVFFECMVEAYDPGRISGPPDLCYPPEGGGVEVVRVYIEDNAGKEVELQPELASRLEGHFEAAVEDAIRQVAVACGEAAAEAAYEEGT